MCWLATYSAAELDHAATNWSIATTNDIIQEREHAMLLAIFPWKLHLGGTVERVLSNCLLRTLPPASLPAEESPASSAF